MNKTDYAPIIRYAEVALNMAEAYARSTDVTNGSITEDKLSEEELEALKLWNEIGTR